MRPAGTRNAAANSNAQPSNAAAAAPRRVVAESPARQTTPVGWCLRCLPALMLPTAMFAFHCDQAFILLAAAFGVLLSAALPRPWMAVPATLLGTGLFLSAAYTLELSKPGRLQATPANTPALPATPKRALRAGYLPGNLDMRRQSGLSAPTDLKTFSVVLPCAYEGQYAEKTVKAIWQNTARHRLHEIIVVDDGSVPPLELPQSLFSEVGVPVLLLRHNKTEGLIGAKKSGGEAATGDVITFFDCHVKPRIGWEEAFLRQMKRKGDHRTVVVPTITSLNVATWQEYGGDGGGKACLLLPSGDFPWFYGYPGKVPIMSGGLLALSRRWFWEMGGYDPLQKAWGGENIDQSLRTWLCGGRIELAEGAFVAHMWRNQKDESTKLKYPMPMESVMRNKARAVNGWFDEFKEKTFSFPEYGDFVSNRSNIGDMTFYNDVKSSLKCASFFAYINTFRFIYLDGGLIPQQVFQLREKKTGLCLERSMTEIPQRDGIYSIRLAPCILLDSSQPKPNRGDTVELQLWHQGNRKPTGPSTGSCCSGLMSWNFFKCLDNARASPPAAITARECDISGNSGDMHYEPPPEDSPGSLLGGPVGDQNCIVPGKPQSNQLPSASTCTARVERLNDPPNSFRLKDGDLCAMPGTHTSGVSSPIVFQTCDDKEPAQIFTLVQEHEGFEVRGFKGTCIDSAGGSGAILYPCYSESVGNMNQRFQVIDERLVWDSGSKAVCLEAAEEPDAEGATPVAMKEVAASKNPKVTLQRCDSRRGQRFRKEPSGEGFLLKDGDSDRCLGVLGSSVLTLVKCGPRQVWIEMKDREQVKHKSSRACVDHADGESPIVYPCHEGHGGATQQFELADLAEGFVSVQHKRGWADHGRKRFFPRCLDYDPQPATPAVFQDCALAASNGYIWERLGTFVPPEYEIWQDKGAHETTILGGES
eukprot:TRINITY_DN74505_c0_g1_i1.p1 TRINITY_DN74505_c0_g1~~TRINITY_DN74505_c0_g1_i1.p1  ORF type:complete len:930 (+),score=127.94 TRINITY_DN74505_c0_g1_i1:202-2991(+)